MVTAISMFILALAVSLDGFGVGVMYGLRKIKIPLLSIIIIAICSGAVIFTSMQIGVLLLKVLSPFVAKIIGSLILVSIGIWAIIQMKIQQKNEKEREPVSIVSDEKKTIVHIELKRIGLVIEILKTPVKADVDRSGVISSSEAALLGIALSLDAFGAGIGAALIGFSPLLTSIVIAFASGCFIILGLRIGFIFSEVRWVHRLTVLPGIILIVMGLLKLL
ncbi:sporulation membrane protein YtaF [Chengkuizengella axinellae]|uniref:Sporulation membrane protein YtaF n=1 Tax=Chengkuizengella axinellae TaxID=3064388 RepID=A0ABT9IYL3_9BACL|nr:sporulation membrane protein YtaF [Chengkuizengella sp. 2205SS18-9]MDP5274447.1 sporulation membrane protein YtaF [Chengkuizengella sp. 2205SS18-9]